VSLVLKRLSTYWWQ